MKRYFFTVVIFCLFYLTQLTIAQGIIKDDFLVNDDTVIVDHNYPAVTMNTTGSFIIAWNDERHNWDDWDIFFQRYNSNGNPIGINVRVNDDNPGFSNIDPTVAMNDVGNFAIAWEDERQGIKNIYYQLYDSNGNPIGSNGQANDAFAAALDPKVEIDDAGNFVIVWTDDRSPGIDTDIYFQMFDSGGNKIGANIIVNDTSTALQQAPSIVMDGSGNFVIAWKDFRNGGYSDIYLQRFNSNGIRIGSNVRVDDDAGNAHQYISSIAIDGSGNFVVVWDDGRSGYEIYFQMYDNNGNTIGSNVKVSDDVGNTQHTWPDVSMEPNGEFIVTWMSYTDPYYPDVEAQRYFANGTQNGGNYLVVTNGPNEIESVPQVAANSVQIAFTWTDNRRTMGRYDTFGKLVTWNWNGVTGVEIFNDNIPKEFLLFQNYPNPFNPSTKIQFEIPGQVRNNNTLVTLKVYDVLGNEDATLVNKELAAGEYEVEFVGEGLTSGVYFYQLKAGSFIQTKKMILVK